VKMRWQGKNWLVMWLLPLVLSGCVIQPSLSPEDSTVRPSEWMLDEEKLSLIAALPPEADEQKVLLTAQQRLQHLFEQKHWQPAVQKVWSALTPFERRLLARMGYTPEKMAAPVLKAYVTGRKASAAAEQLTIEVDRVALVKALKARAAHIEEILMRDFRRVPDHVSHAKQLRALVPALPLLLERKVIEQQLWRWAPAYAPGRGWRLTEKLYSHLHELFKRFSATVQADVDKDIQFEKGLQTILPRFGILNAAGVPDLHVYYDAIESSAETAEGVRVTYRGNFRLLDTLEDPLDQFGFEVHAADGMKDLARQRAIMAAAQELVEHLDRWMLQEYERVFQPRNKTEDEI